MGKPSRVGFQDYLWVFPPVQPLDRRKRFTGVFAPSGPVIGPEGTGHVFEFFQARMCGIYMSIYQFVANNRVRKNAHTIICN